MSDQHNIYDNLREDEERSEEGSVMGSDTADFFVDDEAPIRTPGTADVTDILVNNDNDVSIFNTSEHQENQEEATGTLSKCEFRSTVQVTNLESQRLSLA